MYTAPFKARVTLYKYFASISGGGFFKVYFMGEPSGGNLAFGTSGALVLGRTGPWGKEEWSCSP